MIIDSKNEALLESCLSDADLAVNATPVGMKPDDPLAFPVHFLSQDTIVYDLVYNIPCTPLCKAAQEKGIRAFSGLSMLLYQGVAAFEIWTSEKAPVKIMHDQLREAVYGALV